MSDKKEDEQRVQFNLGQYQLLLIGKLMSKAAFANINNEFFTRLSCLRQIKFQIIPRLDEKERKRLDIIEGLIMKTLKRTNSRSFVEYTEDAIKKANCYCDVFETRVMELLEKKGYLVPGQDKQQSVYDKYFEGG